MTKERKTKEISSAQRLKEIIGIFGYYNLLHGLSPEKLRLIFEDLGPTFIKFGQLLSMRPDMIPDEYCKELARLRTGARPMEFADVIGVLEGEYGEDCGDIFEMIDQKPLGSASIAQVHAAVLKNGRSVVIKVQRPDIYERMEQDIRLLHKASVVIKIFGRMGQVIDLNAVLDEIWTVAKQELDFMTEAEHIRRFTELNEGLRYVAFPTVFWELTTPKALCMERIDGMQIDDTEALAAEGYDLKDIAHKLVTCYAKQVLEDGYFHADPHPGNLRIQDGKIVWLDMGMIGTLTTQDRHMMKKAVMAIAVGDVYALKQAVLGISRHTGTINHTRLTEDIEEMLMRYGTAELSSLNIGQMFTDLLLIAESNGLSMPAGISMLGRGMMTIEGVVSKIDPETNVVDIYASALGGTLIDDYDISRELAKNFRLFRSLGSRSAELSSNMTELVRQAARGQNKLNIEMVGSEEPFNKISHMVNRLIVCILIAAGLIGSSLLCTTDMQPKLLGIPLLGFFGYTVSFILGVLLLVDIFIRKRL